jgi:hypothetical protein
MAENRPAPFPERAAWIAEQDAAPNEARGHQDADEAGPEGEGEMRNPAVKLRDAEERSANRH